MKRTKLSALAPLPPGSMPATSTWYKVPRCFACDDSIKSHRFSTSLLLGHTQYSHSSIPGKLGEYIGDGFVVVVTSQDTLCRNCMNLLNTMDRLEEELKDHKAKLVGNLRRKYGLDPEGGNQPAAKLNRKQVNKADEDDDIIEIQSDEEWTPYNKKRKVTNFSRTKILTCNICKLELTDLNRFMAHLKMHKVTAQQQKDGVITPNEIKVETSVPKSFKCGCCTLSFDKKEALVIHMRQHTNTIYLQKNHLPSNSSNGSKVYPKPTSRTVVEMKLIMDAEQKKNSAVTSKDSALEKPVTVTKVTEKDSGGKVCLLALWNSGSCSDHTGCQNPTCGSESCPKNTIVSEQQTPPVGVIQEEIFMPRLLGGQSEVSAPQVVNSVSSQLQMALASQPQFQVSTTVGEESNLAVVPTTSISQGDTHVMTIPHPVSAPAQFPLNSGGSTQQLSHIVVTIPNQSSLHYNMSTQHPSGFMEENIFGNEEVILNTSDNKLPETLTETWQYFNLNQKTISNKLSDEKLNSAICEENINVNGGSKGKSMPSLDDDIVPPVSTEQAGIKPPDEMGNVAIVNISSVEGNESTYKEEETDWFLASEQSNAVLEPPHILWGTRSVDSGKSALVGVDQVDGARSTSSLPSEVREQSDSVDEEEKSEYFSSTYVVDVEMRQKAEELGDAIFAAFKS